MGYLGGYSDGYNPATEGVLDLTVSEPLLTSTADGAVLTATAQPTGTIT